MDGEEPNLFMKVLWTAYSILRTLGIQSEWVIEIERKEENDNVLYGLIRSTGDGDDAVRALCLPRQFRRGINRADCWVQAAFAPELGRGHRRK